MTELLKTLAAVRRVGDEAEQATVDALPLRQGCTRHTHTGGTSS